jgi:C4-dicarboxylate-specific signal transduction histidine kinase
MLAEPCICFFLLRSVRKILRNTSSINRWNQTITFLLYGIVILFAAELIFHLDFITKWIWHSLLIGIICIAFIKKDFTATRTLMFAVLPFAILSFAGDIFKSVSALQYKYLDTYFDIATVFSVVWMLAMLLVSRKQQKALRLEHAKAQQQEEQRKWMEAKKAELEKIVLERTAELRHQKEQVESTLIDLKSTQAQLIQSEKMASLGELTAGIAHEIQNPLNFVNNFSEVNTELIEEMKEEIEKGNFDQVKIIAKDIKENEEKINHHGKRADAIVKGMLQHSRNSSGTKEPTDINVGADEYLRLAYHGLRAKDKSFNATMKTDFDSTIGTINIVSQDVGRVILNLITNAFYAVTEKKKQASAEYEPTVTISTKKINNKVEIKVKDNGNGIPEKALDKIFQPFFTTKPTGQGTGLGLSLSYDIIKAHNGELKVKTKEKEGTVFIILLPV